MPLRSEARCPRCGGGLPFDVEDSAVCRCGSRWGSAFVASPEPQRRVPPPAAPAHPSQSDLRELVKVLADWIANPGPTDAERAAQAAQTETT